MKGEVEGTVEATGAHTFFGKTAALLEVCLYCLPCILLDYIQQLTLLSSIFLFLLSQSTNEYSNFQKLLMTIISVLVVIAVTLC
ncbi:hypothetical protein, partial [Alicyclobacillus suci]|uniref:hypothetical protein n=1 Tax=Alicyclobacillus suci TaxID=2816080 RepID=UPI001A8E4AA7